MHLFAWDCLEGANLFRVKVRGRTPEMTSKTQDAGHVGLDHLGRKDPQPQTIHEALPRGGLVQQAVPDRTPGETLESVGLAQQASSDLSPQRTAAPESAWGRKSALIQPRN